jgi:hypothetical protein
MLRISHFYSYQMHIISHFFSPTGEASSPTPGASANAEPSRWDPTNSALNSALDGGTELERTRAYGTDGICILRDDSI